MDLPAESDAAVQRTLPGRLYPRYFVTNDATLDKVLKLISKPWDAHVAT